MNLNYRSMALLMICLAPFWLARDSNGLINVEMPVSKRFDSAKTVIIGKVTGVDVDRRVVEVTTVETLKGDAPAPVIRLQIVNPADLIKSVAVGQPVVVFSKRIGSVHIADTWLSATEIPGKEPPLWRGSQVLDESEVRGFPGTTASLVRVLAERKAGKSTLLDGFNGKIFAGGAKELARLDVSKPTFLLCADVNGDGKPDLLVGTPQGIKLFLAGAGGYTDATAKWGLAGVSGTSASAGDVNGDGKPDLLIDKTLYLNDGQKFGPAGPALAIDGGAAVLASSLADFTGGGKPDAALVLSDGRLLVFKNGGPSAAWTKEIDRKLTTSGAAPQAAVFGDFSGDGRQSVILTQDNALTRFTVKGDEPPADFMRLTGDALEKIKGFASGLKNASVTVIDLNGDHRPDLLITIDGATMVVIDRGFGTFLPDPDAGADFNTAGGKGLPLPLNAFHARAAVSSGGNGPDDLLVLSDEGRLFLVSNPLSKGK